MRTITLAVIVLAACQSDKTSGDRAPAPTDYHADIAKICDVEKLSGADAEETTARSIIAAEWLGRNIKTQEARDFLAKVAQLGAADKAKALRAEAARAGLDACPTASAWETLPRPASGGGE